MVLVVNTAADVAVIFVKKILMNNTFTKIASELIDSPHLLERVKIARLMIELLETSTVEHAVEVLLRGQALSLINSCVNHPHYANAHSLLELVGFYDKHFVAAEVEFALAA